MTTTMPIELKRKFESMTPFMKRYAEFRVKGLAQPDAAEKAGSEAKGRDNLGKVGWNTEQKPGVKDYMEFLTLQRAQATCIDDQELIGKIRETYEAAMLDGKYSDANKAMELLCKVSGLLDKAGNPSTSVSNTSNTSVSSPGSVEPKNNLDAFKDDYADETLEEKIKRLKGMTATNA